MKLCCPFLLILSSISLAAPAQTPARVQVLFLTGQSDTQYHDWRVTTPFLRNLLDHTGRFQVRVLEEPRGLTARTIEPYDVLVLNYNGPRWGAESEQAVEQFLRSGKGMVAVHGVSYGVFFGMEFRNDRWVASSTGERGWLAYPEMLGASWKPENIGHAARHVFLVKWVDREHPISKGLEETFLANDELYHRMDLRPNARVLAAAYSDPGLGGTGREEPVLWAVPFGRGRVVHIPLGHDTAAMFQPGFVTSFARSVEWAATGKVTLPARLHAVPEASKDAVRALVVTGGHSYPTDFYSLFAGQPDLMWSHATTPEEAFTAELKSRFDVLVLHDMRGDLPEEQRRNLRDYVESGKGVVSIHHAIVDYTAWPWWHEEVIGGKYWIEASGPHGKSSFKEGVEVAVRPAKGAGNHPVVRGVGPIVVEDEVYKNMWHSPRITVLMETDHPLNDRPVVYAGPHPKARTVYIQIGHSGGTHHHPGYRRLVRNAIFWAARRVE